MNGNVPRADAGFLEKAALPYAVPSSAARASGSLLALALAAAALAAARAA